MAKAETLNIEDTVRNQLTELKFNVQENLSIEDSFDVDLLATRGGLTVMMEIVESNVLNFDSVAKLQTLSSLLQEKFRPIALRKILLTTSENISKNVSSFADDNNIMLIRVKPALAEIRKAINRINYLKPISREEIDVIKIVEEELKEMGDESCLNLLNRVENWYRKGGKSLVTRQIRKEIEKIVE